MLYYYKYVILLLFNGDDFMTKNILNFMGINSLNLFLKAYSLKKYISKNKKIEEFQEKYDWILSFIVAYLYKENNYILVEGIPILKADDFIKFINLDMDEMNDFFENNKYKHEFNDMINIIKNKFPILQKIKNNFDFIDYIAQNEESIYCKIIADVLSNKLISNIEIVNINNIDNKYILENGAIYLDDNISVYEIDISSQHISFDKLFFESYNISTIYGIEKFNEDDLVKVYYIIRDITLNNKKLLNHILSVEIALLRAAYADAYLNNQSRVEINNLYNILNRTNLLKDKKSKSKKLDIN